MTDKNEHHASNDAAPDPFDPEALRLSQDFASMADVNGYRPGFVRTKRTAEPLMVLIERQGGLHRLTEIDGEVPSVDVYGWGVADDVTKAGIEKRNAAVAKMLREALLPDR